MVVNGFLIEDLCLLQADKNGPEFKSQHNNTEQLIKVKEVLINSYLKFDASLMLHGQTGFTINWSLQKDNTVDNEYLKYVYFFAFPIR